jgi:flagellar protein FlaJ
MINPANKFKFNLEENKPKLIGLSIGFLIILISYALFYFKVPHFEDIKTFYFMLGIAMVIAGSPFLIILITQSNRERDIEQMFLEFSRDLVDGVKSGTPISKSIINVRKKDYGSLNPYVDKLANQISLGIPVKEALDTFAREIKNPVIIRSVSLIREAETSGGKIEFILESVTFSVSQIEKLKKERVAAVYNLTVQGYIIFFIFILIMLVMEFKILPITTTMAAGSDTLSSDMSMLQGTIVGGIGNNQITAEDFVRPFLFLLITQGFFAGLVIGKISEGNVKNGLKHSFILVLVAWLISTGAEMFLR